MKTMHTSHKNSTSSLITDLFPIITRTLAPMLFAAVTLISVDCEAQLFRGRFARHHRNKPTTSPAESSTWSRSPTAHHEPSASRWQRSTSRYFDPRNNMDPGSGNPRYIGGFHYTHFQNIGIPSGDIGLRGNALYWRPW